MPFLPEDFVWLARRQEAIDHGEDCSIPNELSNIMARELVAKARAVVRVHADSGIRCADNAPGYLTMPCSEWNVFIPWSLVEVFPERKTATELFSFGTTVSVPPVDNVCLSGSATALSSGLVIGDLDFCQYIQQPPATVVTQIISFKDPTTQRVLITVTYGKKPSSIIAKAPWTLHWPPLEAKMRECSSIDGGERVMIEFLAKPNGLGVLLPVSTVVLVSDYSSRKRGAAKESFVFQEAVAVFATAPLWTLVSPREFASYISFLRKEIETYADENPIKALKRALSLSLILGLDDLADRAIKILTSEECMDYIRTKREKDIKRKLELCGPAERETIRAANDLVYHKANRLIGFFKRYQLKRQCIRFLNKLQMKLNELDVQAGYRT